MAGNNSDKRNVFVPRVDETPVPCPDGYKSTDCVYVSDNVRTAELGLVPRIPVSELINALICRISEQDRTISRLSDKIFKLENNVDTWE